MTADKPSPRDHLDADRPERAANEIEMLHAERGFGVTRIIPTPSPISILEGALD